FDNGTFQFSYSTAMVDGSGDFAAGSQTTISTPAVEFPNGYQVSVTGGHVVSAANASELVIASDTGAKTVTVTVSPTAGAAAG
ncbi:MAG: cellulase family glycosylhydrolase, partial [Mycobacterium sp.]